MGERDILGGIELGGELGVCRTWVGEFFGGGLHPTWASARRGSVSEPVFRARASCGGAHLIVTWASAYGGFDVAGAGGGATPGRTR